MPTTCTFTRQCPHHRHEEHDTFTDWTCSQKTGPMRSGDRNKFRGLAFCTRKPEVWTEQRFFYALATPVLTPQSPAGWVLPPFDEGLDESSIALGSSQMEQCHSSESL